MISILGQKRNTSTRVIGRMLQLTGPANSFPILHDLHTAGKAEKYQMRLRIEQNVCSDFVATIGALNVSVLVQGMNTRRQTGRAGRERRTNERKPGMSACGVPCLGDARWGVLPGASDGARPGC
jgi:hypothetical protein